RCIEAARINELLPSFLVSRMGKIEVPRDISNQLTDSDRFEIVADWNSLVEIAGWVPQALFDQSPQPDRLCSEFLFEARVPCPSRDFGQAPGVAIHIAVDGWTVAAAADRELHPVPIVNLAE